MPSADTYKGQTTKAKNLVGSRLDKVEYDSWDKNTSLDLSQP